MDEGAFLPLVRAPAAIGRVLLARRCVGLERGGRRFTKRKTTNAPQIPYMRLAAGGFYQRGNFL